MVVEFAVLVHMGECGCGVWYAGVDVLQMSVFVWCFALVVMRLCASVCLNLPGAGFRVIMNALTPGGGSPLHSGGLKPATDPNRVRSGV